MRTARQLENRGLLATAPQILLSAGGSLYFDRATEILGSAQLGRPHEVVLRSGCYVTHDHQTYLRGTHPSRRRMRSGRRGSAGLPGGAPAGLRGLPGLAQVQRADDRKRGWHPGAVPGRLRPAAWEVTREDVDRVVGELAAQGLAASTRRLYVQVFKNFHAFLVAAGRPRSRRRSESGGCNLGVVALNDLLCLPGTVRPHSGPTREANFFSNFCFELEPRYGIEP